MNGSGPLRRWALAAALPAAVIALAGCGKGVTDDGGAKSTDKGDILLGMAAPLSGSSAAFGPYMKNGAELAIKEINDKGGVLGRRLALQVEDDACDAKSSVSAAQKLVTAGVVASVGGYCSGATLPTLPVFYKANIPMVIPAANSNELVNQKLKNVFLINGTGTQQVAAAMRWIGKKEAKKVALIHDNTSYSKDIAVAVAAELDGSGGADLAKLEVINPGENDYAAAVESVLGAGPDLIYFTGYYQEGGLLIRQLKQAGYNGAVMVADGSVDGKLVEIAGGDVAEGVYATMTQTPDTLADAADWISRYRAQFNVEPGPYSTQAYDAVRVVAEAISKAGDTDGTKVIAALEAIDGFQLFSGPLKFTPDHTLSKGGFVILTVKDGRFKLQDELK